jgi:hypothetical protein
MKRSAIINWISNAGFVFFFHKRNVAINNSDPVTMNNRAPSIAEYSSMRQLFYGSQLFHSRFGPGSCIVHRTLSGFIDDWRLVVSQKARRNAIS